MTETSTIFLNVDLDIGASHHLPLLLHHLGERVLILNVTRMGASLELSRQPLNAEDAILEFVALIEALPQNERTIWDNAASRTMNIGVQAGFEPKSATFSVSRECAAKVSGIGADLVFTVYAARHKSARPAGH